MIVCELKALQIGVKCHINYRQGETKEGKKI